MMDDRTQKYANTLAELIRMETISFDVQPDKTPFYRLILTSLLLLMGLAIGY